MLPGCHATATEFRLRSPQRFAASFARWTVERELMVVEGIEISFLKAGDSLVLCQRVGEALLELEFG